MNPYALAAILLGAVGAAAWLLVRAYGRERSKAASRKVELAQAIVDRDREERKDALDEPMPGEVDDFWAADEPDSRGLRDKGVSRP